MSAEDVTFELKPVYDRMGITFHQAKAIEIFPEGNAQNPSYVVIEYTSAEKKGQREKVTYDYLINATGPKLNFAATPGLGPEGYTQSVCTFEHAEATAKILRQHIEKMKAGQKQTFVVGTGHGLCTCEGAAFEYTFNLDFELRRHGVRDLARLIYLTNEADLGDFGVGGLHIHQGPYVVPSKIFAESLYAERGVEWITGTHVQKIEPGVISYENLEGEDLTLNYDFAMLLPPFRGADLKAFNKKGEDISGDLFAPSGLTKVDANYTAKEFDQWEPVDWPSTYETRYPNVFAIGIAFAPPHPITKPRKSKKGTPITPAPPRTGMPSAIMGRAVATTIADRILLGTKATPHRASMASLGAACVASAGANFFNGSAASMTMYPIVPDYKKYPGYGRSLKYTFGEVGVAGHWIKQLLHYMFMYKAKAHPLWWMIPE